MFFAQCEVAIALDAHDKWLKYTLSGMAGWESADNSTYRGVYVLRPRAVRVEKLDQLTF